MSVRTRDIAIVAGVLMLSGVLFWPTLWRYDTYGRGNDSMPMRTHRVTGRTDLLIVGQGWVEQIDTAATQKLESLPAKDLALIAGTANFGRSGEQHTLRASLYNGTEWAIKEVEFQVAADDSSRDPRVPVRDSNPNHWARAFRERIDLQPMSTVETVIGVSKTSESAVPSWILRSARGVRPKVVKP